MAARPDEVDPVGYIVGELKRANASGAVVAQEGGLDELVENMLAEGYTLGETVYIHGKRIRYLELPGSLTTHQWRESSQEVPALVEDRQDIEEQS